MKKKLLGVIDATTLHDNLEDLLKHRSLAALPFAGRYRLIDFILSNMVNSGIHSVAIFPKYHYRSLMDHLGTGKNWDLDRKRDGLFFLPSPMVEKDSHNAGQFSHFGENLDFFYRSTQEYSIIANSYTVFNMDFAPMLEQHIQAGCDITELYRSDGRPMEIYLLKTSLLIQLIETREETGYTCMKDITNDRSSPFTICQSIYNGYAVMIDTIQTYFSTSMDLLQSSNWKQLFSKEHPIFTKVKDEPPTQYKKDSLVKNSMIANGCIIEGTVENSIIFRSVKIGKGTVVKNSIIMQKSQIGDNCYLDSVILDKDVKIEQGTQLAGSGTKPFVIQKGTKQGALMNS